MQVAAVTCAAVREGIGSLEVGDNEGAVKMAMDGWTAGHLHSLGDRKLLPHGGLLWNRGDPPRREPRRFAYGVECEEAKCSDTAYQCPVLGLAVTDEGWRGLIF